MRIGVFCGNQPRHLALIRQLADVADEVFAVQECTTVFPGKVADFFQRSDVMQAYFGRVISAEADIFGDIDFLPKNVRSLSVRMGDLTQLPAAVLEPALEADVVVVFGSSYIRSPLVERFIAARAVNIHMGLSPYYRGSSCNFWAMNDGRADMVGATIHMLSKGLDSGGILFHALPEPAECDPWVFTMRAVEAAIAGLAERIAAGDLLDHEPVVQDPDLLIRYTRNAEFTDQIAADFMQNAPTPAAVRVMAENVRGRKLLRPYFLGTRV